MSMLTDKSKEEVISFLREKADEANVASHDIHSQISDQRSLGNREIKNEAASERLSSIFLTLLANKLEFVAPDANGKIDPDAFDKAVIAASVEYRSVSTKRPFYEQQEQHVLMLFIHEVLGGVVGEDGQEYYNKIGPKVMEIERAEKEKAAQPLWTEGVTADAARKLGLRR